MAGQLLCLTRHGRNGWVWEVLHYPEDEPDRSTEYRTNGDGDGLWVYERVNASWRQIAGTAQYRAASTRDAQRKRILRGLASERVWTAS